MRLTLVLTILRDGEKVATLGGLGSTVGMTSDGAFRCDMVTEPLEFGHMMTIGVFSMAEPNPLNKIFQRQQTRFG
jgi:hypothetical protein